MLESPQACDRAKRARRWRAGSLWPQQTTYWLELSSHGSPIRDIESGVIHDADADGMSKENNCHTFEGCDALSREFD